MLIDLRSDTVTKPSPAMLDAMHNAPVGDDVYGEDPSVNALQEKAASLFGTEAALFCPSGTMTNQIALNVLSQPGDEIICHAESHIYWYEGGGLAATSGVQVNPIGHGKAAFTAEEALNAIRPNDAHFAKTSIIAIENTANRGGGACWDFKELEKIKAVAQQHHLKLHIDGARLFNALVAKKEDPKQYGSTFDSISICLSKGLGCPVGSLILGSKELIAQSLRVRKRIGGGMRQAGYLAAAGIYALDNNINRLAEDHAKAKTIAEALAKHKDVNFVLPQETNLVIFQLKEANSAASFCAKLKEHKVLASPVAHNRVRFVFHLDISLAQVDALAGILNKV